MKILFDQGTPVPLRLMLLEHAVDTAHERNWATVTNGELLARAENENYDVLVTTDQNLRYQQNLMERKISVLVLLSTSWPRIQSHTDLIRDTLEQLPPGSYLEIPIN